MKIKKTNMANCKRLHAVGACAYSNGFSLIQFEGLLNLNVINFMHLLKDAIVFVSV